MSALERLSTGYYNSLPVSVANPGGFAGGGHVVNFPAALADIAEVGGQIADIREAVDALVPIRAETWAVVGAFTATPDLRRVFLIDTMIDKLIDSGVWARADLLYVLAAHDEQAARINWISPGTGDLTAVNSPSFTVDEGFTGDGTSSYLSGPSLGPKYTLNSASVWTWVDAAGLVDGTSIRTSSGGMSYLFPGRTNGNLHVRPNSDTNLTRTVATAGGLSAWDRPDATTAAVYRDGVMLGAAAANSSVGFSGTLQLLRGFGGVPVMAAGVGGSLSSTEHAALYDALRRYLTGVGAL